MDFPVDRLRQLLDTIVEECLPDEQDVFDTWGDEIIRGMLAGPPTGRRPGSKLEFEWGAASTVAALELTAVVAATVKAVLEVSEKFATRDTLQLAPDDLAEIYKYWMNQLAAEGLSPGRAHRIANRFSANLVETARKGS